MLNLAVTYGNQIKWKDEVESPQVQEMEARKEMIRPLHSDTYRDQEMWKDTESLQHQVMEGRKWSGLKFRQLQKETENLQVQLDNVVMPVMVGRNWKEKLGQPLLGQSLVQPVQVMESTQLSNPLDLSGHIVCGEFIAAGGSGHIYKGRWITVSTTMALPTIAVKVISLPQLRDERQKNKRYKQIKRELELWSKIKHQNILPLFGIARISDDSNIPAFICPWMQNGNAKEFCSRHPSFPPSLILYDIINGLQYLHTFEPEIVHGDIKAANVLINDRRKACLCDFGLSRFAADNTLWKTAAAQATGTLRWMAPELLDGDVCIPTKASDIYAYAMTCYEIISGKVPFESVPNDIAVLLRVIKGKRPERIDSCHLNEMWDIITRCWEQEPENRPSAAQVLESFMHNEAVDRIRLIKASKH